MTHNVPLDAASLHALQNSELAYMALLGPVSRRKRVMAEAGFPDDQSCVEFAGPAGLDLGGELPEAIVISILSECHAKLHRRLATSISSIL
jgi:xanthine dehydrogenase accessory factor